MCKELVAHEWLKQVKQVVETHIFRETIPCHLSYGFPLGRGGKKAIGQSWIADGGLRAIFISPTIYESSNKIELIGVLIHELIHIKVGMEAGHTGDFRSLALEVGLEGKMTATTVSPMLQSTLESLNIPDPPEMKLDASSRKKQGTRMIKITCSCSRSLRLSRKEIDKGPVMCGLCCGEYSAAE